MIGLDEMLGLEPELESSSSWLIALVMQLLEEELGILCVFGVSC